MASSDLDVLLDMGFQKARAEIAVNKTGGCKFLYTQNGPCDAILTNCMS